MEFYEGRTLKEVLKNLIEINESSTITNSDTGDPIHYKDLQDMNINELTDLIGLLGIDEDYLKS